MINLDKKNDPLKKGLIKKIKPVKVNSLNEIQLDQIIDKNAIKSSKKNINDGELNIAMSDTSNSSRNKCDGIFEIKSPTIINDSQYFSSQKGSHLNQSKLNISKFDLMSNGLHDKSNLLKNIEELAGVKHLNSKQQNEIIVINLS